MGAIDDIVERRIEQARAEGLFDNLAGHGKPLPDLDKPRSPGWWAERYVREHRERGDDDDTALELAAVLEAWRSARPPR